MPGDNGNEVLDFMGPHLPDRTQLLVLGMVSHENAALDVGNVGVRLDMPHPQIRNERLEGLGVHKGPLDGDPAMTQFVIQ